MQITAVIYGKGKGQTDAAYIYVCSSISCYRSVSKDAKKDSDVKT